ncbi:hypothetical protein C0Q70_05411 [Pomacea canaliculata]|uniref:Ionotropic glutamate receptor L-glutamate and glycine-binding domain-containing protein n=1 Tax=Pomacea canaliculata TaxID=400727 RepID=A0A2T7PL52_POMCA|nr:hypothetical protein C0Q70_05411 [Pomacea canaliculata]
MNRAGYNYILATMDMETLNLSRFRHGGVNITGFQLINRTNPGVKEFLDTWSVLEPVVWPGAGSDKVEVEAALSVDALEAFRLALEAMVGRRHDVFHSTFRRGVVYNLNKTVGIPCNTRPVLPWMHGTEIFYSLKRVDFEGLTGRVSFDSRGYRNNYKLDLFTVTMDMGPFKSGEWHSELGLRRDEKLVPRPSANGTQSKRFRIVTSILTKPFLMMRQAPGSMGLPLAGNDRFEGYCKDLADELKERLPMEYILVPVKDGMFGTELPNGSWTGIIGELRRGNDNNDINIKRDSHERQQERQENTRRDYLV